MAKYYLSVNFKTMPNNEELLKEVKETVEKAAVASITKAVDELIPGKVAEAVKEEGENLQKKLLAEIEDLKSVGGIQARKEIESKERCSLFVSENIKAYLEKGSCKLDDEAKKRLEEKGVSVKAMNETTATEGGNFVPPEFIAGIDFIAKTVGLTRNLPAQFNITSNQVNYNVETATVTVAYTDELVAISESTPTNERITLEVKKLAGITIQSSELLQDADIDTVSYLMKRYGEAIALKEDTEFLTGDGTNFTGLLVDANFPVLTMPALSVDFSDITLDDLRDMITQVPKSVRTGSKIGFIMSETVWAEVQKLKDDQGRYQATLGGINAPVISGTEVIGGTEASVPDGFLWNKYPVWTSEVMPELSDSAISTKFVTFGNYERGYRFYKRKDAEFKVSEDATVGATKLFQQDGIALRVITRHAMGRNLAGAIVTLRTAAA